MGYEHNKKRDVKSTISSKYTLIRIFLNENYYCSPLILNDFMCGLNIVICIGGIRDREGRRREGGGGSSTFDLFTYNLPPYEHSKLETQLLGAAKKKTESYSPKEKMW